MALGLAIDEGVAWGWVLPGSIVTGVGYGLAFPAWTVVGVEHVAGERQGVASGLLATTQEVGASIGFALMVAVAASVVGDRASLDAAGDGYRSAVLVAAAIAAAGAALALWIPRRPAATGTSGGSPDADLVAVTPIPRCPPSAVPVEVAT